MIFLKSKVFVLFNNMLMKNYLPLFTQVEMMQSPSKKKESPDKNGAQQQQMVTNTNLSWLN